MKAIRIDEYGGPEVLKVQDVPRPELQTHQLLVRVHAVSVNPVDCKIREDGKQFGVGTPAILGYDVSGTVEAVGDEVDGFQVGDDVFYTPRIDARGSYAEFHAVDAALVAPKPIGLSHEEAAALPLAGCTAWQALIDRAGLQVGDTVLIHGSGGVGSLAVQMAHAAGATVFAVGSSYMVDLLDDLGADRAIDYEAEDVAPVVEDATGGQGVDVVLDTVGQDTLAQSLKVLAPFGRMVTIVESSSGVPGEAIAQNIQVDYLMMQRDGTTMEAIRRLAESGRLAPLVDDVLPLDQAAEAHRRVEEGGVKGNIVLLP